jgi:tetratricopeptide (TPR) repeat protein
VVGGLWLLVAVGAFADDLADAQKRGLDLFQAGRYADALPHLEKALDLAEALRGPEDPSIAVDLNNLAETQRQLAHYDRAEQLYLRAIMIDEKERGAADPGLATSLNNLALVYKAQQRFPEAEKLYLRSLSILERALGPSHTDVAKSLNNLAVLYRSEGQPEKARPLQQRAVAIAERALGSKHTMTQTLRRNLVALGKPPPSAAPVRQSAASVRAAAPPPRPATAALQQPATRAPVKAAVPIAGQGLAIHLASIRHAADIPAEWATLVKKHPSLAKLKLRAAPPVEIPDKGTFYRVAAGSFASRDEAARACAPLKAVGAYCAIMTP